MKLPRGIDRKTITAFIVAMVVLVGAGAVRSYLRHEAENMEPGVADELSPLLDDHSVRTEEDILKDNTVDSRCACDAKDLGATVKRVAEEFARRHYGSHLAEIRVTGLSKPVYFEMTSKGNGGLCVPNSLGWYEDFKVYDQHDDGRLFDPPVADIKMSEPGADGSYRIDIEANVREADGHTIRTTQSFTDGGAGGRADCMGESPSE